MMSDPTTGQRLEHKERDARRIEAPDRARQKRFPFLCENGLRSGQGAPRTPVDPDHVETAIAFLKMFRPTKRGAISSYTLKHDAENWGAKHGMCNYITNGSLITAALQLGLAVEEYPDSTTSPNAKIGISKRDYKKFKAR